MAQPEPKASGVVRRLPWRCREAGKPAAKHRGSARALRAGGAAPDPREAEAAAAASGVGVATPIIESEAAPPESPRSSPLGRRVDRVLHHLQNAEVLSREAWIEHPLQSSARLIPLRWKERINQAAGKPVFDLSFYLKFQPRSVLLGGALIERLDYIPPLKPRRRIGLLTPHLGAGGAEQVLLELAGQIDRTKFETLLIATQSKDSRLLAEWRERVDWIYDLAQLVPIEKAPRFLYSLAVNWELDALVVQNSAAAYSVLPALKEKRPGMQIVDLLHAVDEDWDFFSATLDVAEHLDRRIVISEAGRKRLDDMNTPAEKIRLIRNGVDLDYFDRSRFAGGRLRRELGLQDSAGIVLFAGRLDPVKRPLLLPGIAEELRRIGGESKAHFVVAGDGPEAAALRSAIQTHRLEEDFTLLGHVPDIAAALAAADVLLIPSRGEGVPLVLLEALAMQTPVVACRAGAIEEALPLECGVLVEPGMYEETRLAEALAELLADPERRAAMGRLGREFAEKNHAIGETRRAYRVVLQEIEQALES